MNLTWKISEAYLSEYRTFSKKMVCSVTEIRTSPGVVCWKGDLNNGYYFSVVVVDGVMTAGFNERELKVPESMKVIAYNTMLDSVSESDNILTRFSEMLKCRQTSKKWLVT